MRHEEVLDELATQSVRHCGIRKQIVELSIPSEEREERYAVKRLTRRWRSLAIAALAASVCRWSLALSQERRAATRRSRITEEDYFNTPGQIAALAAYTKQFEAAHPGVTVKRQYVPFANLDTKLLTQATGGDLPNLLAVDNPFVSTMISTGQVVPLSGLKGFSTKGYYPAVIDEGLSTGKYYSYPWQAPTRSR